MRSPSNEKTISDGDSLVTGLNDNAQKNKISMYRINPSSRNMMWLPLCLTQSKFPIIVLINNINPI